MKYKVVILFLCCLLSAAVQAAELPGPVATVADTVPDKHTLRRMLDWVGIFSLYSDVDISSKVDLKQYGEVADLGAALLMNNELRTAIAEFNAETFINVYPYGLVKSDEWIFKKLNEVTRLQYDVQNAPYITLEVYFEPANGNTGYKVTSVFAGSPEIKVNFDSLNTKMKTALPTVYASVRDAKADVNAAVIDALQGLQRKIGTTYAPNIALFYQDKMYMQGQTIEVWQRLGGSMTLQAVDRKANPVSSGVSWMGAAGTGSTAVVALDSVMENVVSARSGRDEVSITVRVKKFNLDWKEILRQVLTETIDQLLKEGEDAITTALEKHNAAREKAASDYAALDALLQQEYAKVTVIEPGEGSVLEPTAQEQVLVTTVPDDLLYANAVKSSFDLRQMLIDEQFKELRKVILLAMLDSKNFDKVLKLIEKDAESVAMNLLTKVVQGESLAELKSFVSGYLNEKMDEVLVSKMGPDMGALYTMINEGKSKDEIRYWLAARATEKIEQMLN